MNMKPLSVLLALVGGASSVPSAPLSLTRPPFQEEEEKEKGISSACDELLHEYERAGWNGAVLVARDGKALLAKGYGRADPEKGRPNTETTLFEIGSLSKQITAAAILKLEQQEKLTTDDPIAKHLPGVPTHARKITIMHLLTHTSGMPRNGPSGRGADLEEAVKAYLAEEPKNAPGAHFEYWNGGYALLAGIVERASGKSFTRYCEEELFAPAGMTDTGFTGDADLDPARAAVGESQDAESRSALEHPYMGSFGYQYRGMGGVVTTALDLLKWDRTLAGTAVLGEKARAKLFTPVQEGYACGWYVGKSNTGRLRQSHEGDVRGFHVDMMRFPEQQACVVVLANTDLVLVWQIAENLECLLFGRSPRHPPPQTVPVADEELGGYGGRYESKDGALVVKEVDGGLEVGIEGQALLDEIVPREDGMKRAELDALNAKAVQFIEAMAEGDVEFLDEVVLNEELDIWVRTLVTHTWPRQIEAHGTFKSVRALGATVERGFVRALVAIEHERDSVRASLGFGAKGLQGLDWDGPRFVATLRLVPKGRNAFEEKRGEKPHRFEFTLKKKRVTGVTTGGLKLQRTD